MEPTLSPGDRLVVTGLGRLRPGDLVVTKDPRNPTRSIVKRLAAVGSAGEVEILGDNPDASTDSRAFGRVPAGLVVGRAVYRYWPSSSAGSIPRVGG